MTPQLIEAENEYIERMDRDRVDDELYGLVSRLMKISHEVTFGCIPEL